MNGVGPGDSADAQNARLQAQVADLLDVIYRVSHDLQAPVRRMSAFSELVRRRADLDERSTTWLNQIGTDAQLAQRRLNALLAYSRIGRDWAPEPTDMANLIARTIRGTIGLAERPVMTDLAVPTLTVDAVCLATAMHAVLDNAARFADQVVEVAVQVDDADGFSVAIFNDGPPVSERQRERCLQLFNSDEPAARAGLGLATAQRVMRLHDGAVQVTDRDGQGCLVILRGRQQGAW